MADLSILMETRSTSALFKRAEQLKRWEESETNRESSVLKIKSRKINFTDGCVFLAACSSGDKEEVKRLLKRGADIDTANVDGLTALHQACIDDNLDMVEFLVEHGSDVNRGDNEGWTALHATASCGFVSIAKYLIENGANVAAVNNDGELPLDIAESDEMEELLQQEIDNLGIDCELARNMEEHVMMEDANQMLNSKLVVDKRHPKSGATALHVAAAKGYIKVMSILIQAGVDLNVQDCDGWTPLHAAAHWGQKESCKVLAENLCDMEVKNFVGQTALDVADSDLDKLLEELKKKQAVLRKERESERPDIHAILDRKDSLPMKRRTSVTRMSVADKTNIIAKDKNQERAQIETTHVLLDTEKKSPTSSSETETEETSEDDESKSAEDSEVESSSFSDCERMEKKNMVNMVESAKDVITTRDQAVSNEQQRSREPPAQAPAITSKQTEENEDVPSWRRGVRKPGNSTDVTSQNSEDNEVILRSSSVAKVNEKDQELKRENRRPLSADHVRDERKDEPQRRERVRAVAEVSPTIIPVSNATTSTVTVTLPLLTAIATITTVTSPTAITSPSSPSIPTTPTTANNQIRRSFVPPVRDEESETQRKAHAKRVRETRRSTQGVTLEDLKSAEQLMQKTNQDVAETQKNAAESGKAKDNSCDGVTGSNLERKSSWRSRLEQEEKNKPSNEELQNGQHSSSLRVNSSAAMTATTTTTTASGLTLSTETTPVFTRRSRPPSLYNPATVADVEPIPTVTVTLRKRSTSKTRADEDEDFEDDLKEQDKENENKASSQATQAAILRRRRPKRRSTGVVYLDLDDGESDKADLDGNRIEEDRSENKDQAIGDRGYRSARYGSSGSLSESGSRAETPSRLSERISRAGSVGSTASQNETSEKDYKVLYEEQKVENERLQERLKKSEKELEDSRQQLEKATQNNARNSTSDADRREKRALERKLSEMEEELKQFEQLKTENQRLRDENGALIRVISKLSK